MPQILVVTETPDETASTVVYSERIAISDLESAHFSGQLVERVGWAVDDADRLEHRNERMARVRRIGAGVNGSAPPASPSGTESPRSQAG